MAMRRQTWLLLVVLAGVGLFAAVHPPRWSARPKLERELVPLPISEPQLNAAYARIKAPRGFRRTHECWVPTDRGGFCAARWPSIPPTQSLLSRWALEAGFSIKRNHLPRVCRRFHRDGLQISSCSLIGVLHGEEFSVFATAAVLVRRGVATGTSATVGHPDKPHGHLRGTQLNFIDGGTTESVLVSS
jgi:hypothetical protein